MLRCSPPRTALHPRWARGWRGKHRIYVFSIRLPCASDSDCHVSEQPPNESAHRRDPLNITAAMESWGASPHKKKIRKPTNIHHQHLHYTPFLLCFFIAQHVLDASWNRFGSVWGNVFARVCFSPRLLKPNSGTCVLDASAQVSRRAVAFVCVRTYLLVYPCFR